MSFVVKARTPWKTGVLWTLVSVVLLATGWTLFEYGRFSAGFDSIDARKERRQLLDFQTDLQRQISDLREEKAILERAQQIERQAYNELDLSLKTLQGEILELKEELAFYRGIVSPKDASTGLRLQRFEIEPNGQQRGYHYKVVLTQVLKNDRQAYGQVNLQIEGLQNGASKILALRDVTAKRIKDLDYKFKYFQNLEGDMVIPEGFSPLRATATVDPGGRSRDEQIEKTIEWSTEEIDNNVGQQQETETDRAH